VPVLSDPVRCGQRWRVGPRMAVPHGGRSRCDVHMVRDSDESASVEARGPKRVTTRSVPTTEPPPAVPLHPIVPDYATLPGGISSCSFVTGHPSALDSQQAGASQRKLAAFPAARDITERSCVLTPTITVRGHRAHNAHTPSGGLSLRDCVPGRRTPGPRYIDTHRCSL